MSKAKSKTNTDNGIVNSAKDIARVDPRCIYSSTEQFNSAVNEYFSSCDSTSKPYTIPGLLYHLRISNDAWADYQRYTHTREIAKSCRQRIEAQYCELALSGKIGAIFLLKASFGYIEANPVQQHLNINVTLSESELDQRLRQAGIDPKSIKP